jgi:hypothetical protein
VAQESEHRLSIDLYVRGDVPRVHRREAVIDQLKRLDRENRIVEFRIHPWPRAITLTLGTEMEAAGIPAVVRSFSTWAAQHGRRISASFDVRISRPTSTGESDERLVLPLICLAAYSGDDLVGVVPSSDRKSVHTVEDALDAIAARKTPIPEGGSASVKRISRESAKRTTPPTPRLAAARSNATESGD